MKKLLKAYGLNSDMQYFELIVESIINGQRTQAKDQFKAMPVGSRKSFVKSIMGYWSTPLTLDDKNMFINLI